MKQTFTDNEKGLHFGEKATHWTNECMKYCEYAQGEFKNSERLAAIEYIGNTDWDTGCRVYDAEGLIDNPIKVVVYGLVKVDSRYYWNGETKTVILSLNVTIEQE